MDNNLNPLVLSSHTANSYRLILTGASGISAYHGAGRGAQRDYRFERQHDVLLPGARGQSVTDRQSYTNLGSTLTWS